MLTSRGQCDEWRRKRNRLHINQLWTDWHAGQPLLITGLLWNALRTISSFDFFWCRSRCCSNKSNNIPVMSGRHVPAHLCTASRCRYISMYAYGLRVKKGFSSQFKWILVGCANYWASFIWHPSSLCRWTQQWPNCGKTRDQQHREELQQLFMDFCELGKTYVVQIGWGYLSDDIYLWTNQNNCHRLLWGMFSVRHKGETKVLHSTEQSQSDCCMRNDIVWSSKTIKTRCVHFIQARNVDGFDPT